ncbi:AAA family ATPase [Streptomyces sp. NPDC014891]|uniref:AAA family ATPase n=1 Tax=Streptomyces sp. NPDC014891 TaxID=3364929 RepID=UPI0036FC0ED7
MENNALTIPAGTLYVAIGPAASGKSTAAADFPVDVVVCLDELRREISGGNPGDQTVTPAAVARQNTLLDEHLAAGRSVLVDSTNVEPHVRAGLLELAQRHGRETAALRFLTDLDTCLERNAQRAPERRVPDDVLRWQHSLSQDATPETLAEEGFTYVLAKTAAALPEIRFIVITSPDRRHAFYWATPAERFDQMLTLWNREEDITAEPFEFTDPLLVAETRAWIADTQRDTGSPANVMVGSVENGQWVNWNLDVPRPPVPAAGEATMSRDDALAPERIADAVAVLRKAQEGDQKAHEDLGAYFPGYESLVMQTDYLLYLDLAARAGLEATHLLILRIDSDTWGASVDTCTSDLGMPLASVNLGDYPSRTEAVRETVRAATENGWMLAPEQEWADFDCGGGEIHIPIYPRPVSG